MSEKMEWNNIEVQEFGIFSQKWADFIKVVREAPILEEKDKSFLKFIAQIYFFRVIAGINWAKLHVTQDAQDNIKAWIYVYKEKLLNTIMHDRQDELQHVLDEGYAYAWYEAGSEVQDVVELLTNINTKLLMIVEDQQLEQKLLDSGWEEVLDQDGKMIHGQRRPERKYIKFDPEKQ